MQVYGNAQSLQSFEPPFYITSKLKMTRVIELLKGAGVQLAPDSPQLFTGLDPQQTFDVLA